MIAILTSTAKESSLFAALCAHRSWPCQTAASLEQLVKLAEKQPPRVLLMRHRFSDGYSDDALAWLRTKGTAGATRTIVLVPADFTGRQEARQIELGADCVLRDPLRLEVLLAYAARYRSKESGPPHPTSPQPAFTFAGAQVLPHELQLHRAGRALTVTPQVIALLRLLHDSAGQVTPYPKLYTELFNRNFSGDTANCRVLLAKAAGFLRGLDIDLRRYVKVVPKSGYLYEPAAGARGGRPSRR